MPKMKATTVREPASKAKSGGTPRTAANPSRRTPVARGSLLIIEDDLFLAKMMSRMLEAEGIECTLAGSGREGLRRATATRPRLIILDIILPDLDGFAVLSRLKANAATRRIPVLIVSNLGQEEDIQQGLELGAQDYIVKSDLSLDDVVAKVKKHLR